MNHPNGNEIPMLMKWQTMKTILLTLLLGGLMASAAPALELATPFADNAVLQRDMKVPVWGWGKPDAKMTVKFAGQTKTTNVGKDGKWRVELDPLKASFDPRELTVTSSAGQSATLKNVLVGEVWMATGQSNMQWTTVKSDVSRSLYPLIQKRVEAGEIKQPVVREGKVTDFYAALHPVEHATLEWSTDIVGFSAIASAFAHHVAIELEVPVGILNCAFSTTQIQAWIPRVGFRDGKDEYTQKLYLETLQTDPTTPEHKAAWGKFYQNIEDTIAENKKRVAAGKQPLDVPTSPPGNLNGNRDSSWLYNARVNPLVPYAIRGAIWNQGYASQGEGLRYYENLHSLIRGWRIVWDRPDLPVYFHQFYRGGNSASGSEPGFGGTIDMRTATWLASKDIPNASMASQIDIGGSIHYNNKSTPGIRLALQALKKTYGKDIVADGPMFKKYTVKGDKVIVEFDHADGGLVVGDPDPKNMAIPKIMPKGEAKVNLFYVADANRVWYPATFKIDGDKVIVGSPKVKEPRGISYAASGVGFQPNLYNKALLPTTPFVYYDNKLVTAESWPDDAMKIDGVEPKVAGLEYHYRKMPLLSTQFRDNAVLQAGQPVTIWGSAVHGWVYHGAERQHDGKAVVHFSFGDVKKTIPVTEDMLEWQVMLPAMPAGMKKYTLEVKFTIDGELIHERKAENIVFGDVWYVAVPDGHWETPIKQTDQIVRMMDRKAKRDAGGAPSRFSVATSTTPENRFASVWAPAEGFAAALGHAIAAKTNKPVGIIFMQTNASKGEPDQTPIKQWIAAEDLNQAPSLMEDYKQLASLRPGNAYYDANARRYMNAWKTYWGEYIPELMSTGKVPDAKAWGSYPRLAAEIDTKASQVYNVMVCSFTPAGLKGIVFIPGSAMVESDQGAVYGEQLGALANSWRARFDADQATFFYGQPAKSLAAKITKPSAIKGPSQAIMLDRWPAAKEGQAARQAIIDTIVGKAY
jgi:sialate O-acetylesterase